MIELIGDQGVSVGESNATGGSGARDASGSIGGGETPHDLLGHVNLDDPVVARVRDQGVSAGQSTGERGRRESVAVTPDDGVGRVDLDHSVVALVRDQ